LVFSAIIVIGIGVEGLLPSKLLTIVSLQSRIFDLICQFWSLLIPTLSFGWFCYLVGGGILIAGSETRRPFAIYWLTVVTAAVQLSYGTSYTSAREIIASSAYLATALSFGCVLIPLLLVGRQMSVSRAGTAAVMTTGWVSNFILTWTW
jgi:hypothetical protein